jgi:hypothetical protein
MLIQTRAILLYWVPWLLFMSRPGQPIARKDLPNPFSRNPFAKSDIEEEKLINLSIGWHHNM